MSKFQVNNERSGHGDKFSTTGATVAGAVVGGSLAYWLGDGSGILTAAGAGVGTAAALIWDPGAEERAAQEEKQWRRAEKLIESATPSFPDAEELAMAQIRVEQKVGKMKADAEAAERAQAARMGKMVKEWLKGNP